MNARPQIPPPAAQATLLVVEDDPFVGQLMVNVAASIGLIAYVVPTVGEAEHHLDAAEPTAVSVDLKLAGAAGGIDMLNRLAERQVRSPVVLVSGADHGVLDAAQQVAQGRGLRIAGVLHKPFENDELRALLERACEPEPVYGAADLEAALTRNEFFLEFQPKVFVAGPQRVIGAEALVRWQHPQHGLVLPGQFIQLAESSDLAMRFTQGVLRGAALQWRTWKKAGHDVAVGVNLPAALLQDAALPKLLRAVTEAEGCPPMRISLEVRDAAFAAQPLESRRGLFALEAVGFNLCLDDCAGGYASLDRVQGLPFSEIKIDRSLVGKAVASSEASAVVRSIVDLGNDFGLAVCAMGVESGNVHDMVVALGCDFAQGHHYGRPRPPEMMLK